MDNSNKKILILAGKGQSTQILFHALKNDFDIIAAIVEDKESTKVFLKRRLKKLGLFTVLGQVLFQIVIAKPLTFFSKTRSKAILAKYQMNDAPIDTDKLHEVSSVNAISTIDLVKQIAPDLIIVNGTRIISKNFLSQCQVPLINTHAGMTPMYRGVHGMYWALANGDASHAGVTVHYVDSGIDTGQVIAQAHVTKEEGDNFSTYPLLQLVEGIHILKIAIANFFDDNITLQKPVGESKLYYHPTIFQYIATRLSKGVK